LISRLRYTILFIFLFAITRNIFSQQGRLENEYKLSIPQNEVEDLWQYIRSEFCKKNLVIDGYNLNAVQSVEKFEDAYYDNNNFILLNNNIG